ncbi:MAG: PD40 domain-containing protein [Planctomycetes bacterium]|nr:PD40 domain-containing protein [Planctomycetota bacterium]
MPRESSTLRLVAIVLALLGAGACLALGWVSSFLPFGRGYTDGQRLLVDAPELHRRVVVHGEAEPWARELVAERPPLSRVALSPDGRIAVFSALGANERADLFWSEKLGERWLSRGPLLALNQPMAHELAPFFDAEGALYFASDRPGSRGFDLYVASWDGESFRDLYRLSDEEVNGPWDEVDPCYDPRTGTLYFASNRPRRANLDEGADFDLFRIAFRSDGSSSEVERLEALSSPHDERSPVLHPSGGTLLFASQRSGGEGGFDLYAAASAGPNRGYQAPQAAEGAGNSAEDELDPGYLEGGFAFSFRRASPRGDATAGRVLEAPRAEGAAPAAELVPPQDDRHGLWRVPSLELEQIPSSLGALDFVLIGAALALIALLIYLGRRWSALDILTKALLISLLVHILLLVLSRRVEIESTIPPPEAPPAESLLDVAFVPQEDPSMSMRGGAIERELEEQELEPEERSELAVAEAALAPAVAAEELTPAEREAFEAALPERSAEAQRAEEVRASEVALASPEAPTIEREAAPELEQSEAQSRDTSSLASVEFESAESRSAEAPREARESATPAPTSSEASTPERATREFTPAERVASAPERRETAPAAPSVAVADIAAPALPPTESAESPSEVLAEGPRAVAPSAARSVDEAPALAQATPTERASDRPAPRAASAEPLSSPSRRESSSSAPLARANTSAERRTGERTAPSVAVRSPLEALPLAPSATPSSGSSSSSEDLLADLGARTPSAAPSSSSSAAPSAAPSLVGAPSASGALSSPAAPTREVGVEVSRAGATSGELSRPATSAERAVATLPRTGPSASPRIEAPSGTSPLQPVPRAENRGESSGDLLADLEPSSPGRAARAPLGAVLGDAPRALPGPSREGSRLGAPAAGPAPVIARASGDRPIASSSSPSVALQRAPSGVDRRFERRFGDQKLRALEEGGGSAQTEQAVQTGLRYLASKQDGRGFWGDAKFKHAKYAYTIYGKSGLALLAFLGAGHTQASNTEFSPVVARGIQFLVRAQDAKTGHFGNCSSYGHAIATYALCEAYALTKDASLREPLQRALDWIVENQNRQTPGSTEYGGWTYYYPDAREFDPYARASITSWQVMALESGRIGGFDISPTVVSAARQFLEGCFDPNQGWFRYNHQPSRLRSVYPTLPGSTPASLFALRLLGTSVDHRLYEGAWAYTLERRPKAYKRPRENDFVQDAAGNLYFWYYGTLAFFQRGGEQWNAWNSALKSVLLPAQSKDGSWRPIEPYAETAGDTEEDRIYTTAMCVLMLEVYYRYFTPLLSKR